MSKKGGTRPGAGRPKGKKNKETIEKEEALKIMRKEILKKWRPLIDKKIELAEGIFVMKTMKDGKVKIYKERPDGNALEYLFSMVVGKPKEEIKIENENVSRLEILISKMMRKK